MLETEVNQTRNGKTSNTTKSTMTVLPYRVLDWVHFPQLLIKELTAR